MNKVMQRLLDAAENQYACGSVQDAVDAGLPQNDTYIDTGIYILNGLLSGSIYCGLPQNKISVLAGPKSTGKSMLTLRICKKFLDDNPEAAVYYFESENAISNDDPKTIRFLESIGIDLSRFHIMPIDSVQNWRTQMIKMLDVLLEVDEEDRPKILFCLDSLGNLTTTKEVTDTSVGSETKDMTRAALIKGAFRVLTMKLARAKSTLLITNHCYDSMAAMFPTKVQSGGSGIEYLSSITVFLSRKKDKVDGEVVGNVIHCKLEKARFTIENKIVDILLRYDAGFNPYYGLSELAAKYNLFKSGGKRLELPDGTKVFEKQLTNNPEKYYTEDILDQIDELAKKEFLYGSAKVTDQEQEDEDSED